MRIAPKNAVSTAQNNAELGQFDSKNIDLNSNRLEFDKVMRFFAFLTNAACLYP